MPGQTAEHGQLCAPWGGRVRRPRAGADTCTAKELVATTPQGTQAMPTEGGPYHYFRVLRDIFVSRRVQDHPAGVRVQAVNVQDAVLDVPSCPLKDLPKSSQDKGENQVLLKTEEENVKTRRVVSPAYLGERKGAVSVYGAPCKAYRRPGCWCPHHVRGRRQTASQPAEATSSPRDRITLSRLVTRD